MSRLTIYGLLWRAHRNLTGPACPGYEFVRQLPVISGPKSRSTERVSAAGC